MNLIDDSDQKARLAAYQRKRYARSSHSNEVVGNFYACINMDVYKQQVKESDGFDVEDRPGPRGFGQIRPLNLSKESIMAECKMFAGYAINAYNEKCKGKNKVIELEEVVKAMLQGSGGVIFYLTFVAKNPVKNKLKTYQAIVYGPRWNFEVKAFRTKPKDDVRGSATSPKKWKWDNRSRCCGGSSKGKKKRARI